MSLPGVGVPWIKAKLDTGARTSSLHAFDVEEFEPRRRRRACGSACSPWQDTDDDAVVVECPVHDRAHGAQLVGPRARSASSCSCDVVLIGRTVTAEVTLTNRDEMGFRMLIGREALRHGFVVDAGHSFLGGGAPRHARRRNRGRPTVQS